MDEEKQIEGLLRWIVFSTLALVFAAQAFACRGIFGDGANFLLGMLRTGSYPWWDGQRLLSHFITKTPTILALKFGAHNLVALRYFFSFWTLLCPLLVWCGAFWTLRRDLLFWPFVMLFCFVYYSTCFHAVAEYNLCFALAAYCFAGLVRPLPRGSAYRASLLAAALFLSFHYPATLFLGGLLCLLVAAKPDEEWQGAPQAYRWALMVLFALSAVSSLWEIIAPRDPNNYAAAKSPYAVMRDVQFWCVLLYVGLVTPLFLYARRWLYIAVGVLCLGLLIKVARDPLRLLAHLQFAIRAYMSLALALYGVALWWFRTRGQRLIRENRAPPTLVPATLGTVLFVALSAFDIGMSLDYADYLDAFRSEINGGTGKIAYENSGLYNMDGSSRFMWSWNFPLMSIILRDNEQKAVILNPAGYRGYEPFDAQKDIPDLSRYYR